MKYPLLVIFVLALSIQIQADEKKINFEEPQPQEEKEVFTKDFLEQANKVSEAEEQGSKDRARHLRMLKFYTRHR